MFAKVFTQILDSSLAEDWQTRHVFEDLLKLCDATGVVDMTHEAIARRTNTPLEIVNRGITELEKADTRSRNPDHEGRRIIRLDEHRNWGWLIVNYEHYRNIASDEQRKEKTRLRVQRHRESQAPRVTPGNGESVTVTPGNASNARKKKKKKQRELQSLPDKGAQASNRKPHNGKFSNTQVELVQRMEAALGDEWENDRKKWLGEIATNPDRSERIVVELEGMIKRGEIRISPARAAEDLRGRFAP